MNKRSNRPLKRQLTATIGTVALCALGAAGQAQATVITFDDPAPITIDANGIATYTESGFTLSGPAATFLPIDASLIGGFDPAASLSLKAVGGATFSLASLDDEFVDLGIDETPGLLSVVGILNGITVGSRVVALGDLATATFGSSFGSLTEVTFTSSSAFALDNINATTGVAAPVPEPSTWLLTALALAGVVVRVRQGRGAA